MSTEKTRVPLSELELTVEYRRLTQKQKLWISTYVAGGMLDGNYDAIAATRTAYAARTPEIARVMHYNILQTIGIVAVLSIHFNREPIEDFLVTLDRAIRNKKLTIAQLQALKLKSDILGFGIGLPRGRKKLPPPAIPPDVQEASRVARKAERKPRKPPEPKAKDPYNYF
jgi:hypothetical protein